MCVISRMLNSMIVLFVIDCEIEYFVVFDKMINWCTFERKIGL